MHVVETHRVLRHEPTARFRTASARVHAEIRVPAYTILDFLDDQRRLLRRRDAPGSFEDRFKHLDGWYLVLRPEAARPNAREARAVFRERYGPGSGALRLARFLAVSRFLNERRADIAHSGLSAPGDPLSVREELVQYLIARYVRPGEAIPGSGLTRFLDEWGHRWH
jgi:hypothetical protein